MKPEVERVAYNGMPYAHFIHPWYALMEEMKVLQAQVVTGIEAEPYAAGAFKDESEILTRLGLNDSVASRSRS